MTREEMIEALVDQVDNWDFDTLLSFARDYRREALAQESPETLSRLYDEEVKGL